MSPSTSSTCAPSRFAGLPEYVSLSSTTTSSPAAARRFAKCEPMNPAPPVTSTRTAGKVVVPGMRRWLAVLAVGSVAVLAAGVIQVLRSHGGSLQSALGKLEPAHPWFLGRSFESLRISRIQRGGGVLVFTYGNCKKRCVQVQDRPLAGHNPV